MKYYLYLVMFNKEDEFFGYPFMSTEVLTQSTLEYSLDFELQNVLSAYSDYEYKLETFNVSGTRAEIIEEYNKLIEAAKSNNIELLEN